MSDDFKVLEAINIRIGEEESKRDQASYDWFADLIAPQLAFLRANERKPINNREEFLETVKPLKPDDPQPSARQTTIEAIEIFGDRAIVRCVVALGGSKYHNLRLFVRRENEKHQKQWKLLGWANEKL